MQLIMRNILFLFTSILFISSCESPPIFPEVPAIEWNKFSKDTVQQFTGQVTMIVGFTDGDGNLGISEGDSTPNMLIIDTRTDDTIFYRIPNIPQQGVASGISGDIEVDMSSICCVIPGFPVLCGNIPNKHDSVVYKIQIKDRDNNWSNVIESKALKIKCFQ